MKTKHISGLFLLTALALSSAQTTDAEVLSPEQALARLNSTSAVSKVRAGSTNSNPTLQFTQTQDGEPTVYLFSTSDNSGFMLVSADDVAPALLGYGDTPATEINPTLKWWIQEYGRQITWARNAGMAPALDKPAKASAEYTPIAPMTTTRWNQDAPFNDDCPEINGTRCVTGCVATALSQVMKYHNWPKTGTGSNSYTPSSVGSTLSVNFANTTYDWDNMINVYDGSATSAQKAAVATLMLSAGVSVNMDYTTDESSATSFAAAQAMVNYFNYDKGIVFYSRDYYTISDWNDLVYNQLKNYGPVQYSGQSNQGGHSFVCDGYSSDGYFHINWGWGGMSDGYFLLTALNPTSQGIGGSTSGYNFDQDIIGNVKPADGTTSSIVPNFVAQQFSVSTSEVSLGNEVSFSGPMYSFSLADISGSTGLKLVDSNNNVSYIQGDSFSKLQPEYGFNSYYVILPSTLAEGTYTISPAIRNSDGTWYDMPVMVGAAYTNKMTVSDGTATFTTVAASDLSVTDVNIQTELYIGANFEITATVSNTGSQEYLGGVRAMLINTDDEAVAEGDEYPVDIQGGDSTDITYVSGWTVAEGTTLSAGSYYLCFVDDNGNQLSDMQTVTLNAESTPTLALSDFNVAGNSQAVNKSELEFTGRLSVTEGYFGGTLTVVIFPYSTSGGSVTSVASYSTNPVFLSAGQSDTLDVKADFSNGQDGSTYFAMLYNGSNPVANNQVVFTLAGTDAVNDIAADTTVTSTEYLTIQGVNLGIATPAPGLYLVRNILSDGSVQIQKTIIK